MAKFLGEVVVNDSPYTNYSKKDWALMYIHLYGTIDGEHHKTWVIDQVARILCGTKVIVTEASWDNGETEYRFDLDEPSEKYFKFVKDHKKGEDGPNTYDWDVGIAP